MRRDTRQKDAIFRMLRNSKSHPTADQIYAEVRKEIPRISKGTVYRNLQILKEDGMVTELKASGSQSRYEIKLENHYHFRCDHCGRVFDLDEPVDSNLNARVSANTGFKVVSHQTEFRGLCKACSVSSPNTT